MTPGLHLTADVLLCKDVSTSRTVAELFGKTGDVVVSDSDDIILYHGGSKDVTSWNSTIMVDEIMCPACLPRR